MKKKLSIALVVIIVGIGVWAVHEHREGREHRGSRHMAKELRLTQEQKASIEQINIKFEKDVLPNKGAIKSLRLNLKEELLTKNIDEQKVKILVAKFEQNQIFIDQMKVGKIFDTYKLLTDEQKLKFKSSGEFNELLGSNNRESCKRFKEGRHCKNERDDEEDDD